MLTWNEIVDIIYAELCLPVEPLEYNKKQLEEYLKKSALREISNYHPDVNRITLDCGDTNNFVNGNKNQFYIVDPDDMPIYGIVEVISNNHDRVLTGGNLFGAFTPEQAINYEIANEMATNLKQYSPYYYTYNFKAPNILEILPNYNYKCVVEYERLHKPDLTTIPTYLDKLFVDLCKGMSFKMIGRIRQRYQNVSTPYGEITLNGDALKSEGEEIYNNVIEQMKTSQLPSVTIDRG